MILMMSDMKAIWQCGVVAPFVVALGLGLTVVSGLSLGLGLTESGNVI